MTRASLLALPLAAMSLAAPQEARAETRVICEIDRCRTVWIEPDVEFEAGRDAEEEFSYSTIRVVIDDILEVSGLVPNFQILSTGEVDNAAALIDNDVRFLAYNPSWIRQYETDPDARWILYAIMAHEIGHHLQGHTISDEGSRPPTELEADEYAGFTLAGLGATEAQALALWRTFDRRGSSTHPPRDARLAAVSRGYRRYVERVGPRDPVDVAVEDPPAAPPPTADEPEIVVAGRASEPGEKGGPPPAQSGARERTARVGEICELLGIGAAGGEPLRARACVSSSRAPVDGASFGIGNLFDGDWDTAWAEGVVGDGTGSVVAVEFDAPRRVAGITLVNGFAATGETFARNGRARAVRVTASNGSVWTVDLLDTDAEQSASTDLFGSVSWIEAEVTEVYPGSRYPDLAITEWRFDLD